jgi:transposase InsO family protein
VLSDNGTCFKRRWSEACAEHRIAVRKRRAYRPQTNGKAERFIRTLLERCAMCDRTSRPRRSPRRTPEAVEQAILPAREALREGPHLIGWALGIAASTVHAVLSAGALRGARLGGWYGPGSGSRSRCS